MRGHKVGALMNRIYDSLIISQHGGILQEIAFNNTFDGVLHLIRLLRQDKIDGFLVSRTTHYYFARKLEQDPTLGVDVRDFVLKQTEKNFIGGEYLVAGMLLRSYKDFVFFREYFRSNWAHIQGCYNYDLNYRDQKFVQVRRNPLEGLFVPFFVGSGAVLLTLICMGVVYEYRRRKQDGDDIDGCKNPSLNPPDSPNISHKI